MPAQMAYSGGWEMALLRRELHRTAKAVANNEDTWTLVFNTDTKRFYVEHAWQHVAARGRAPRRCLRQWDTAAGDL
jgi:hypothetical protein